MTTISYNQKCNKNKDCASNVCEMLYDQGIPQGRYCLESSGIRYTKTCNFPKDCLSGICSKIYSRKLQDKYKIYTTSFLSISFRQESRIVRI